MICSCWCDRTAHELGGRHVVVLVAQQQALERPQGRDQLVVAAVAHELLVELPVVRGGGHRVGALVGHRRVDLAQPRDGLGRELRRRAHRQALQQDDHRVALAHLDLAQRRDGEGAAVLGPDEAVALQAAQGLAHDGRVDLELVGESVLVQPRAGLHLAADDPALDLRPRAFARAVPHSSETTFCARATGGARAGAAATYIPWDRLASQPKEHSGPQRHARAGRVPREGARLAGGAQGAGARGAQHARRRRGRRLRRRPPPLAGQAGRGRPGRRHLAGRRRRPGTGPDRAGHRQPGDRARGRARDPRRHRRRHARADDHRPRHRGAEGALPRADAPRRRGVVPAVLRAGRRLGPRGGADARAPRGRRHVGAQRPEGVDDQRAVRRRTACCWRAPTPSSPSTRA